MISGRFPGIIVVLVRISVCVVNDCCCFFNSEKLFMQMADCLAGDGFKELGYEFVNIDVC